MADVILNLIDPLEARFTWRDKTPEQITAAKRDMVEAFRNVPIEDLKAALMRIILNRKFSTMPTVGDINDQVCQVQALRKADEIKAKARPLSPSLGSPMEALLREKEDARERARDWLRNSPLGQESLRDGWCQQLHNIVWQIYYRRAREGKPIQHWNEIGTGDISVASKRGEELIQVFKSENCIIGPALMRAIVLKEKVA